MFIKNYSIMDQGDYLPSTQHIHGLVQEKRNSIANALELCLSCTDPSTLWPGKKWLTFADSIFRCIFLIKIIVF